MNILITLLGLTIIIIIHELGHYWAAIRAGIGVHEFSIGMGPKIIGKKIKNTDYNLRLLPIGGFVKLAGMDDKENNESPPETNYYHKPVLSKMIVISAGSIMNILLGFLLYLALFCTIGTPTPTTTIETIFADSPAFHSTLLEGDKIIKINNVTMTSTKEAITLISTSPNTPLVFTILRNKTLKTINITPEEKNNKGLIGIQFTTIIAKKPLLDSLQLSAQSTLNNIKLVFKSIGMLINGQAGMDDMAGPLGIIQFASYELNESIINFILLLAMISISLGTINLFPLPILDGGHLMLLSIEALTKKTLSKKWETLIFNIFGFILIVFMLFLISNDLFQWKERIELLDQLRK